MTADREVLRQAGLKGQHLEHGSWNPRERLADAIVDAVLAAENDITWRDEWRVCAGPADDPAVFKDGIRNEEHLQVVLRHARNQWSGEYIWSQHRKVGTTKWERVDA